MRSWSSLGCTLACLLAPSLVSAALVSACGGGTPPPATSPPSAPPAPAPAASSTAPTEATGSPASSAAPALSAPAPTTAEPPPPPCIDGQVLMGACICDKGKSADATGHCVYTECPKTHGGITFRDPTTGQCMECPTGTKPGKDGHCEH